MREPAELDLPNEKHYLNCIRCGLCLAVCPTYREHLSEAASPRGRVALARKGLEGELELSQSLFARMYACFDCMACSEICPVGIRPADLVLEMRTLQEFRAPSRWKIAAFRELVGKPQRMEAVTIPLRLYEHSGLRSLVHALGPGFLPSRIRDLESMLPRLPQRPLRKVLPEVAPSIGVTRYRVGFFLGCAQSLFFAGESAATLRVLRRNGCMVIAPRGTVCCGMPARGFGRTDIAREQARTNIAIFEAAQVEVVLTDCATCGSTLKEYGSLLANDPAWSERAAAFCSKVQDICQFLESIPLENPTGIITTRVTYHDPCHLRRGQGVWIEPRKLLQRIKGLEFVELPEADGCCGSAGSQLITHYDTSSRVLDRKLDAVVSTKAGILASGCPGCRMQFTAGARRRRLKVEVVHPVTLLDRAYGAGNG